jgi:DNA adenine methylase
MQKLNRHVTINSISLGTPQEVRPTIHQFTALGEDMTAVEPAYTAIRSPFRWVGGKSRLRKKIIALLPLHECYVEVFGGAAWVLFGKSPCRVEVLNDIDGDVVNFFRVVKEKPEEFLESFEWTIVSRNIFQTLREQPPDHLSDLQRAHRFYYLTMAGWGGEFSSPRFQTSVSDGGHGNRLIGALKTLPQRIMPVYQRLQTVIIEDLDWRACLARYDKGYEEKRVVMYLDPPYPQNNCNYQHNMRQWKEHEELARALRSLRSRFVLTSYNLPEIRAIYDGFFITEVDFAAGMPTGEKERSRNHEIIVTNYDPALVRKK